MSALLGLGLDAGGTKTRWALSNAEGSIVAEGTSSGMTGVQLLSEHGLNVLETTLNQIGETVLKSGAPGAVCAGFTGLDQHADVLARMIGSAFGVDAARVELKSDIEIAYHDLFEPGEGYVIYAGTGSIAAYIDERGVFHRAGGRGVVLDDAGGGFWIAREAGKHIWRREDEEPGAWQSSPMARAVFARIGGSDWSASRAFFYGKERGEIGRLALAVAEAANDDPVAMPITYGSPFLPPLKSFTDLSGESGGTITWWRRFGQTIEITLSGILLSTSEFSGKLPPTPTWMRVEMNTSFSAGPEVNAVSFDSSPRCARKPCLSITAITAFCPDHGGCQPRPSGHQPLSFSQATDFSETF